MSESYQYPDVLELLPLRPVEFLVLLVLADGERHGYGIVQDIAERTENRVKLLPGNLYAVLRRLGESGLLEESAHRPAQDLDDQRRRYYRVTELGERVLAADAERMRGLVRQFEASNPVRADAQ